MENSLIRTLLVIAFLVMGAAASVADSEINTQPKPAPAAPGNIGVIDNTGRTGTVDRHKSTNDGDAGSSASSIRQPQTKEGDHGDHNVKKGREIR